MNLKTLMRVSLFLFGLGLSLVGPQTAASAEKGKQFLGQRHGGYGIECSGCHTEKPPQAVVPTAVCLQCHQGSYSKLADRTAKASPNPHLSHLGELSCESCHHSHKGSEDKCGTCHDEINLTVP